MTDFYDRLTRARINVLIMHKLKQLIDNRNPIIFNGNWEECRGEWRFEGNLHVMANDSEQRILQAQIKHGKENVTVGWSIPQYSVNPIQNPVYIGLYIRDAQEIMSEHTAALADDDALAHWLRED